jgi:H+/gluconate symporter-like permease
VAHEPTSREHVSPVVDGENPSYDAFVVIGLVAVIVGAATGSLTIALAVFAAPALALGGTIFVRSHL